MSHSPEKLREFERMVGQETQREVHTMPRTRSPARAHACKRSCWCNPELDMKAWEEDGIHHGGIHWVHRLQNEA